MRRHRYPFGAVCLLGLVLVSILPERTVRALFDARRPASVDQRLRTLAVPRVIDAGPFVYVASGVTGSAVWVGEYLTAETLKQEGSAERPSGFHLDPDVPRELAALPGDYKDWPFDAGHMPAARNYGSQADVYETFRITVAPPQVPSCNRGPWRIVEEQVRELIDEDHSAYVVTLVLYLYREHEPEWIDRYVLVPTHYAKAVLVMHDDEPERMLAWCVPNDATKPVDPTQTIDVLEDKAQLDLFGWLPDDFEDRWEARK